MSLVTPTRILVVGSGGREHALAWKLGAEPGVNEVVVAPGSAGIAEEPRVRCEPGVDALDPDAVVAVARRTAAELVVIGPEAPLEGGVTDVLHEAGFAVFGPTRAAARLETSKAFCEEVADAANVPRPYARSFAGEQVEDAIEFIHGLRDGIGAVLKTDGLAAGKGVVVTQTEQEAVDLVPAFLAGREPGAPALVIQARLAGREVSAIAICDGDRAIGLPLARDHKRLLDDDRGPNTGGMGAYSPVGDLRDEDVETILDLVHRRI